MGGWCFNQYPKKPQSKGERRFYVVFKVRENGRYATWVDGSYYTGTMTQMREVVRSQVWRDYDRGLVYSEKDGKKGKLIGIVTRSKGHIVWVVNRTEYVLNIDGSLGPKL